MTFAGGEVAAATVVTDWGGTTLAGGVVAGAGGITDAGAVADAGGAVAGPRGVTAVGVGRAVLGGAVGVARLPWAGAILTCVVVGPLARATTRPTTPARAMAADPTAAIRRCRRRRRPRVTTSCQRSGCSRPVTAEEKVSCS